MDLEMQMPLLLVVVGVVAGADQTRAVWCGAVRCGVVWCGVVWWGRAG
jgi:hypothetical protein